MGTTIRVDTATHAEPLALSAESGDSLGETVGNATEALRRQRFAHRVTSELAKLREDEDAWHDYLAEADSSAVRDGGARRHRLVDFGDPFPGEPAHHRPALVVGPPRCSELGSRSSSSVR